MTERHLLESEAEVDEFVNALQEALSTGERKENLRLNEMELTNEGPIRDYFLSRRRQVLGF